MGCNQHMNIVEEYRQQLNHVMEFSCDKLHNSIREFIFQRIDYSKVDSFMPQWIIDCGISPELSTSKDAYEKFKRHTNYHPIFGLYIYYFDIWCKNAAIQDRLQAVATFLQRFYNIVPYEAKYEECYYTSAGRICGEQETEAHVLLNSIFVAYASIFDLLAKVAVEQFEFGKYDFSQYKKMRSVNTLFNKGLKNIDPSLKEKGLLFSEPSVIRKIETFRNEYVHNGPWDLRCCIYYTAVNGEPADVVIYSPDMDEFGNFITSGSRNKFYSQGNRINIQLPILLKEATSIIESTIERICTLYQKSTINNVDEAYTNECIKAIVKYQISLVTNFNKTK